MNTQFQTGYLIESIKEFLIETYPSKKENINRLYFLLSHFDVKSNIELSQNVDNPDPVLAVLNNLITRGLPTRLNFKIEQKISDCLKCFQEFTEYGALKSKFLKNDSSTAEMLYRALHIIEPRLNKINILNEYEKSWERLDSSYEEDFLYEKLPAELGENYDFIIQLIEKQRSLSELLRLDSIPPIFEDNFRNQRVDFSIEFPYELNNDKVKGIILEIDGTQHDEDAQKKLDKERDNKSAESGWETFRIKTSEWSSLKDKLSKLNEFLKSDYYSTLYKNYSNPLYGSNEGLQSLQLMLSPIAIARIQKVLIELLLRDIIKLSDPQWKIAIIERDVPCGALAIEDLKYMLKNILELQGKNATLPEIDLKIYTSEKFFFTEINEHTLNDVKLLYEIDKDNLEYDVVLDISVLEREGLSQKFQFKTAPKNYLILRSCHSIKAKRNIYSGDRIKYGAICRKLTNDTFEEIETSKSILTNLLRDIFRKKDFRIGQLPILNRSLQLNSVVGLLQTGGGKSLTYQLAALLQPGITIVIDPIKSLMKDQVDGLLRNYIDNCLFINSSMNYKQRKAALERVHNGEAVFLFVSPERLQIKEFRDELESLYSKKLFFSYCVIDEAHCVSEWGHDFRTSYLRLGENAIKYCLTKDLQPITLIGLTATASFDVLTDILREISTKDQILDSDAIIRFETTNRPEIQYEVIEVNIQPDSNNEWKIREQLGKEKHRILNDVLTKLPQRLEHYNNSTGEIFNDAYINDPQRIIINGEFNEENEKENIQLPDTIYNNFFNDHCSNAGLIFCPHRSWYFGATDKYNKGGAKNGVFDTLSDQFNSKAGTFIGTNNEDDKDNESIENDNIDNQNKFISNDLNLLVCTKAFGMGIDKPNVRFSTHINYPSSIESFIQESGRIGRDGKLALAYIIFNHQIFNVNGDEIEVDTKILEDFFSNSFRGVKKEKVILWELLNKLTFPRVSNKTKVDEYLEEVGYDGYCNIWTSKAGYSYLFLQKSFDEKYGCLPLNTLQPDISKCNLNSDLSREILNDVRNFIINNTNETGISYLNWLQSENQIPSQPGIGYLLTDNDSFEITLNFKNDWERIYQMMTKFLSKYKIKSGLKIISDAHLYTTTGKRSRAVKFDVFYERLSIYLTEQQIENFRKIFYQLRDKQDTEKAIYRLAILGIVDEYEVNYHTNTYTIKGIRKSDEDIRKSLKDYLLKYYSENKINKEFAIIDNIEMDNFLFKVIKYLIEFIYSEIGKKRKQAIYDMKYACQYRLQTSNIDFKDYVYYYFNSKYARQNYEEDGINKSLYDRMLIDGRDDIELVYEFIGYMESQINNFRHLRGACIRMLQLRPESFSIYLLKAYAILSIEQKNPSLLDDGIQSMLSGFDLYLKDIEPNGSDYFTLVDNYIAEIRESTNGNINTKIEEAVEILKLKYHTNWLQKFNNKFLVDYERTNS